MNPALQMAMVASIATAAVFIDSSIDSYSANTQVVLHMDGTNGSTTFTDAKGGSFTGGATAAISTTQSKFGGASVLLAANDSVSGTSAGYTPTTGDFTAECWAYVTGNGRVLGTNGTTSMALLVTATGILKLQSAGSDVVVSSAGAVAFSTWQYFAVSRVSGVSYIFVNGVLVGNAADTSNYNGTSFAIGYSASGVAGYIDEARLTIGVGRYTVTFTAPTTAFPSAVTDPSFASVSLLMHMDGTNGGTTFTDQKGATVTRNGTPTTSTTKSQFGGASLLLNGSTDYLTLPQIAAYSFGTGDFTVELWINFTSINSVNSLINLGQGANGGGPFCGWWLRYDSSGVLNWYRYDGTETQVTFATTLSTNTGYHVAICRSGTSLRAFVNGTQVGSTATNSLAYNNVNSDALYIGRIAAPSATYTNAYIDEVRITKGVARYTTNFTAPAAAFPDS